MFTRRHASLKNIFSGRSKKNLFKTLLTKDPAINNDDSTTIFNADDSANSCDATAFQYDTEVFSSSTFTKEYCHCVLVTGDVGFVGSHVAETLLKEGRKVVVYDIFNSETSSKEHKIEIADLLK